MNFARHRPIASALLFLLLLAAVFFTLRQTGTGRGGGVSDGSPPGEAGEGAAGEGPGPTASYDAPASPPAAGLPAWPTPAGSRYSDPEKGAIRGSIRSADGSPLPFTAVEIFPSALAIRPAYTTITNKFYADRNGDYYIRDLAPGKYAFMCGPVRETAEVSAGKESVRDIVLAGGASISGEVRDPEGRLLFPAVIYLFGGQFRLLTRTLESGRFELKSLPEGQFFLGARCEGFAPSLLREMNLAEGGKQEGVVVTMQRGGRLTGSVRTSRGAPVADAVVALTSAARTTGLPTARTDRGGSFEISGVAPGDYPVMLWLDDAIERSWPAVTIRDGATTSVEVVVEGESRISGQVSAPPGEALPAEITVCGRRVLPERKETEKLMRRAASADGQFSFGMLEAGDYAVWVETADTRFARGAPVSVSVPERGEARAVIALFSPCSVQGLVKEDASRGVEGARVDAVVRAGGSSTYQFSTFSARDGGFELKNFPPGEMEISVSMRGFHPWKKSGVRVSPGKNQPVLAVLIPMTGVEGIVLGADGRPATGATLYARPQGDSSFANLPQVGVDGEGRYRINPLSAGTWVIYAVIPNPAAPGESPTQSRAVTIDSDRLFRVDFRF